MQLGNFDRWLTTTKASSLIYDTDNFGLDNIDRWITITELSYIIKQKTAIGPTAWTKVLSESITVTDTLATTRTIPKIDIRFPTPEIQAMEKWISGLTIGDIERMRTMFTTAISKEQADKDTRDIVDDL